MFLHFGAKNSQNWGAVYTKLGFKHISFFLKQMDAKMTSPHDFTSICFVFFLLWAGGEVGERVCGRGRDKPLT